jgi:hypothetical protein
MVAAEKKLTNGQRAGAKISPQHGKGLGSKVVLQFVFWEVKRFMGKNIKFQMCHIYGLKETRESSGLCLEYILCRNNI